MYHKSMLVLTRKEKQKITINEDIVIEVLRISGNEVRLGFSAPKTVRIQRTEVYRKDTIEKSKE